MQKQGTDDLQYCRYCDTKCKKDGKFCGGRAKSGRAGRGMAAFGAVIAVMGTVLFLWMRDERESVRYQKAQLINAVWSGSNHYSTEVDRLFVLGIVLMVVGAVLLLTGIVRMVRAFVNRI